MKLILVVAVMTLINFAEAQEKIIRKNAALVVTSMSIMPCTGQGDATNLHQCEYAGNRQTIPRCWTARSCGADSLPDHSRAGSIPTRRPFGRRRGFPAGTSQSVPQLLLESAGMKVKG